MIYAGIGSRATPRSVGDYMSYLAESLSGEGHVLRSGAAQGADSYFEKGAVLKEIYLPWEGFNNRSSKEPGVHHCPEDWQRGIAMKYHPRWDFLNQRARLLMMRNSCQIFGASLESPKTDFVLCWTADGKDSGGTGQALRIARDLDIPVFNLKNSDEIESYLKWREDNGSS